MGQAGNARRTRAQPAGVGPSGQRPVEFPGLAKSVIASMTGQPRRITGTVVRRQHPVAVSRSLGSATVPVALLRVSRSSPGRPRANLCQGMRLAPTGGFGRRDADRCDRDGRAPRTDARDRPVQVLPAPRGLATVALPGNGKLRSRAIPPGSEVRRQSDLSAVAS
jgi:hypothetical protein